jgi:SAM-dependent methyltransferase
MSTLPHRVVRDIRRSRRYPRPSQFDYLHLRALLNGLAAELETVTGPVNDVLDIFCGSRPYNNLLPSGARCTGLDIDDRYGEADVVTTEFLPFPDKSFDLLLCTEAFHYVREPTLGIAEMFRVLRPGGTLILTVPLVWEYERDNYEHRYTGPELAALFEGWESVRVVENGGYAVSWTTLTGRMLNIVEEQARTRGMRRLLGPCFVGAYIALNGVGLLLDWMERQHGPGPYVLPMDLLLSARRPSGA